MSQSKTEILVRIGVLNEMIRNAGSRGEARQLQAKLLYQRRQLAQLSRSSND